MNFIKLKFCVRIWPGFLGSKHKGVRNRVFVYIKYIFVCTFTFGTIACKNYSVHSKSIEKNVGCFSTLILSTIHILRMLLKRQVNTVCLSLFFSLLFLNSFIPFIQLSFFVCFFLVNKIHLIKETENFPLVFLQPIFSVFIP